MKNGHFSKARHQETSANLHFEESFRKCKTSYPEHSRDAFYELSREEKVIILRQNWRQSLELIVVFKKLKIGVSVICNCRKVEQTAERRALCRTLQHSREMVWSALYSCRLFYIISRITNSTLGRLRGTDTRIRVFHKASTLPTTPPTHYLSTNKILKRTRSPGTKWRRRKELSLYLFWMKTVRQTSRGGNKPSFTRNTSFCWIQRLSWSLLRLKLVISKLLHCSTTMDTSGEQKELTMELNLLSKR